MAEISFRDRMTTQLLLAATQDDGMSTAEYAIGTMVPRHRVRRGHRWRNLLWRLQFGCTARP